MMKLSVIGINHKTAPVAVRERFALPDEQARRLLRTLHGENVFAEALVVDTCNRTEVYFVHRDQQDSVGYLLGHVAALKGTPAIDDTSAFYRCDGAGAVSHLFHVAASLDSQIVGEHQILGQLKDAYRLALDSRSTGFLLNKLFHWAFRVGKKVQTETQLGQGAASVSLAAVELAGHVFSDLAGKTVMLVGAGETAQLAARALLRRGAARLVLANRTLARARELAAGLMKRPLDKSEQASDDEDAAACPALATDGRAASRPPEEDRLTIETIDLDAIADLIGNVDLVISSTAADHFVLTHDALAGALRHVGHSVVIIDIAVPRDVDPRLAELPSIFLYNLDDLDRLVAQNVERRRREIPLARAIVDDEVTLFVAWLDSRQTTPTIKLLRECFDRLRQAEIRRYASKFASCDQQQLDKFTASLCSKILHKPMAFLGTLGRDNSASEALQTIDVIRRMFDLDSLEQDT